MLSFNSGSSMVCRLYSSASSTGRGYLCSVCIGGGLKAVLRLSIERASILLCFTLVQFKEGAHPPHPFQGGRGPSYLLLLVGDDVLAGLLCLPYLLLQGAHLLLGLLPNLLLAVSGKSYLGFELRLLRLSRGIEFRELDTGGSEGPSYDEYRALLGYSLWQIGDRLGNALDEEVPRRRQQQLLFVVHLPAPAPSRPPRLYLIARVVGLGVVLVCVPPEHSREKALSAHVCLPPSALIYLPLRVILTLVRPLRNARRSRQGVTSAGGGPRCRGVRVDEL